MPATNMKWRSSFVPLLTIVFFLALLSGCGPSSNGYVSGPESFSEDAAEEGAAWSVNNGCASHAARLQARVGVEVIMVETATDVSHVGGTIWLGEAKTEFPLVVITDTTVFLHADGSPATFEDVVAGMCIQVAGQSASVGEVRAQRVVLLDVHYPPESQHEEHRM